LNETIEDAVRRVRIVYRSDGLRVVPPYVAEARTYVKAHWRNRTLEDIVQREFYPITSAHMAQLVQDGRFRVDGNVVASGDRVLRHNEVLVSTTHCHEPPAFATPLDFEAAIVGECDRFVAVNKPASVVVHPTGRFRHNSVVYALAYHLNRVNLSPVHRLDRCASGLLLFAKSAEAARLAFDVFAHRRASKLYIARVVNGARLPLNETRRIDLALPVRSAAAGAAGVDAPALAPASTLVRAVRYDKHTNTSLVLCYPVTGRLHQIRIHLASVGTPIDGDPLHGTPIAANQTRWLWAVTESGWKRLARPGIDPELRDPLCPTCQRIGDNAEFDWDDPYSRDSVLSFPLHSLMIRAPGVFEFCAPLPHWCAALVERDAIDRAAAEMFATHQSAAAPL
jgi:RluA family pseudouridine synthase